VTTAAIDSGARPAVPAGILKSHVTEMSRRVGNDAMDVAGGKGVMLGPKNFLGRGYQSIPIAITVEGANILTRNLIIFGQGAIRCHPFVLREMKAARNPDREQGVEQFDRALFGHIGFTISNAARAFVMALTFARFESVGNAPAATRRYFQHIERFSASFAFATDVAMLALGGYLKKKESISARLGDVLSYMYLASMVLKHYEDEGLPPEDLPIIEWSCRELLYHAQEQLHGMLRNFPVRWLAALMRVCIFPRGLTYFAPGDRMARTVADLALEPGPTRTRLARHVYATVEPGNPVGLLQQTLELAGRAELLEKRVRVEGVKTGRISALDQPGQVDQAEQLGLITAEEAAYLRDYDARLMDLINVDDFAPGEFATR
jgi:acyl-CoA dehydrogenase